MASFLTSAQKAAYEAVMQDMHDTFARTIYAYKESQKIIVSTDPNFNFLYNNVKGVSKKKPIQDSFRPSALHGQAKGSHV